MTTPTERTRAVLMMEKLVAELIPYSYGDKTRVLVPMDLLRLTVQALRHYPTASDLRHSALALPGVWGEP